MQDAAPDNGERLRLRKAAETLPKFHGCALKKVEYTSANNYLYPKDTIFNIIHYNILQNQLSVRSIFR